MSQTVETLTTRLRADLTLAMRARNTAEAQLLRSLIAAIDNAQAVPTTSPPAGQVTHKFGEGTAEVQRAALSGADLQEVLQRELDERIAAADELARLGRNDRAELLRREAAIVARYLAG